MVIMMVPLAGRPRVSDHARLFPPFFRNTAIGYCPRLETSFRKLTQKVSRKYLLTNTYFCAIRWREVATTFRIARASFRLGPVPIYRDQAPTCRAIALHPL